MTAPRLNLIVVRSLDPKRTKGFFELLGIRFQEEQHGSGPIHWSADLDSLVLEVYPAKSEDEACGPSRLGFEVEDATSILKYLRSAGVEIVSDLKQSKWGLRAVVRDPDDRSVELVQR
jgi:catechol 2,3-dioxygenase-like lactoylglutathione lyase family enzyme